MSNSPILNIFIRFGDIRRRTSKSTEIEPNFACFWPLKFFWLVPTKTFNRHYKIIKLKRGDKISLASKSRGPNSNALANAERALSTLGWST